MFDTPRIPVEFVKGLNARDPPAKNDYTLLVVVKGEWLRANRLVYLGIPRIPGGSEDSCHDQF